MGAFSVTVVSAIEDVLLSFLFHLPIYILCVGCKIESETKMRKPIQKANEIDNKMSTIVPSEYHPIKIFRVKLLAILFACMCVSVCQFMFFLVFLVLVWVFFVAFFIQQPLSLFLLLSFLFFAHPSIYLSISGVKMYALHFIFHQMVVWMCFLSYDMVFLRTRYHQK